jgi:uncharacterized membrane protein
MKPKHFLEALDDDAIVRAIGEAENRTSAEIRVFVTEKLAQDVVAEAQKQFLRMGMTKTEQRNGVLIYFAPKARNSRWWVTKGFINAAGNRFGTKWLRA